MITKVKVSNSILSSVVRNEKLYGFANFFDNYMRLSQFVKHQHNMMNLLQVFSKLSTLYKLFLFFFKLHSMAVKDFCKKLCQRIFENDIIFWLQKDLCMHGNFKRQNNKPPILRILKKTPVYIFPWSCWLQWRINISDNACGRRNKNGVM